MDSTTIDDLKAFLNMGFSVAKLATSLSDGFQLSDLGDIVSAARSIPGGFAAAPKALTEYLNMTDEQAAPLEQWVVSTFSLPNNASLEVAIETALKVVIELHSLARLIAPKV